MLNSYGKERRQPSRRSHPGACQQGRGEYDASERSCGRAFPVLDFPGSAATASCEGECGSPRENFSSEDRSKDAG